VISGLVSIVLGDSAHLDDNGNALEFSHSNLYPGDSIGDAPLRLLLQKESQYFYLKSEGISDVLLMGKNDIPQVLNEEINSVIAEKLIPLSECAFFQGISPYNLFVLASQVKVKSYRYGEIIIKQGEIADSLYLVISGNCKSAY